MLEQLKTVDKDKINLETVVAIYVFGKQFLSAYEGFNLSAPEWAIDNVALLEKEIRSRRKDNIEKAIKKTRAAIEATKSAEDKRKDLAAELEKLTAALAKSE